QRPVTRAAGRAAGGASNHSAAPSSKQSSAVPGFIVGQSGSVLVSASTPSHHPASATAPMAIATAPAIRAYRPSREPRAGGAAAAPPKVGNDASVRSPAHAGQARAADLRGCAGLWTARALDQASGTRGWAFFFDAFGARAARARAPDGRARRTNFTAPIT